MNEQWRYQTNDDAQHETEKNMFADSPVFGDKPVGKKFRQANNAEAHHGEHNAYNNEYDNKIVTRLRKKQRHKPEYEQTLKKRQLHIFPVAVEEERKRFLQKNGNGFHVFIFYLF